MNITTIKLSDYADYMQTHHLRAVRSGWREGKLAFVEVEPESATLAEKEELTAVERLPLSMWKAAAELIEARK